MTQASNPRPLRSGDQVALIGPSFEKSGMVEAVESWKWIRFCIRRTVWLDVVIPSGFTDWSVVCRLTGPATHADCERIALAVVHHEHAKRPRGKITTVQGLAEILDPAWRMKRLDQKH